MPIIWWYDSNYSTPYVNSNSNNLGYWNEYLVLGNKNTVIILKMSTLLKA